MKTGLNIYDFLKPNYDFFLEQDGFVKCFDRGSYSIKYNLTKKYQNTLNNIELNNAHFWHPTCKVQIIKSGTILFMMTCYFFISFYLISCSLLFKCSICTVSSKETVIKCIIKLATCAFHATRRRIACIMLSLHITCRSSY